MINGEGEKAEFLPLSPTPPKKTNSSEDLMTTIQPNIDNLQFILNYLELINISSVPIVNP